MENPDAILHDSCADVHRSARVHTILLYAKLCKSRLKPFCAIPQVKSYLAHPGIPLSFCSPWDWPLLIVHDEVHILVEVAFRLPAKDLADTHSFFLMFWCAQWFLARLASRHCRQPDPLDTTSCCRCGHLGHTRFRNNLVCTYVRMYVCTYVRMYVCMYVCM